MTEKRNARLEILYLVREMLPGASVEHILEAAKKLIKFIEEPV